MLYNMRFDLKSILDEKSAECGDALAMESSQNICVRSIADWAFDRLSAWDAVLLRLPKDIYR
jgi:hypothetical protein